MSSKADSRQIIARKVKLTRVSLEREEVQKPGRDHAPQQPLILSNDGMLLHGKVAC